MNAAARHGIEPAPAVRAPALARVVAIARKEFRHLSRDPRTLAAVLLMPMLQLLLFAYAISFDVRDVPTVVVDQDRTPASRAYVDTYRASSFFRVLGEAPDLGSVDRLFDRSVARIVVVVPAGFARSLAAGQQGEVGVFIDGTEPTSAQIGQAYAVALNQAYGRQIAVTWADRQGLSLDAVGTMEPRIRTWYNPERRSSDFLIPGLMVVIIMIVTVMQTAVSLVRERDQGTAEQVRVSPVRDGEMILGKLTPWTILAFLDMAVITAVGMVVFGLPLRGAVWFLALGAVAFVVAALAIGLIISAVAPSLETANISALLVSFLPAFMLSGFAFPLESIPTVLQWLSYAFPGRYMVSIARGVFLKGAGAAELWPEVAAASVLAVVLFVVAVRLYGRRVR